jgi:hypothetical protein
MHTWQSWKLFKPGLNLARSGSTKENTNGLTRPHLPKGTHLSRLTERQCDRIARAYGRLLDSKHGGARRWQRQLEPAIHTGYRFPRLWSPFSIFAHGIATDGAVRRITAAFLRVPPEATETSTDWVKALLTLRPLSCHRHLAWHESGHIHRC